MCVCILSVCMCVHVHAYFVCTPVEQFFPMSIFVCYHLPSDRDDSEHPNAFTVPKENITLGELKKAFPLPGTYHFRFKTDAGFWLDCTDENACVPLSGPRRIVTKVLRLSWTNASTPAAVPVKPVTSPNKPADSMDLFGSSPVSHKTERTNAKVAELDLFS